MAKIIPIESVQPSRISKDDFQKKVRDFVKNGQVKITAHLARDHPERSINQAMIERCLEKGTVQSEPRVNLYGNFEAEIYRHMAGQELTVVAAIEWESKVIVITAY